jgi:hypothetical protein
VANKYLEAAAAILSQTKSGMHYQAITDAAIRQGLLQTRGRTPDIAMSSILSREVAENPHGRFRRIRPGVYGIRSSVAALQSFSPRPTIAQHRLDHACRDLHLSRIVGARRGLRILREAVALALNAECSPKLVGTDEILLELETPIRLHSILEPWLTVIGNPLDATADARSALREISRSSTTRGLQRQLQWDSPGWVVNAAVELLDAAANLRNNDRSICLATAEASACIRLSRYSGR